MTRGCYNAGRCLYGCPGGYCPRPYNDMGAGFDSRFVKMCESCGTCAADPPSKLCPGCEAYREHTQ